MTGFINMRESGISRVSYELWMFGLGNCVEDVKPLGRCFGLVVRMTRIYLLYCKRPVGRGTSFQLMRRSKTSQCLKTIPMAEVTVSCNV